MYAVHLRLIGKLVVDFPLVDLRDASATDIQLSLKHTFSSKDKIEGHAFKMTVFLTVLILAL